MPTYCGLGSVDFMLNELLAFGLGGLAYLDERAEVRRIYPHVCRHFMYENQVAKRNIHVMYVKYAPILLNLILSAAQFTLKIECPQNATKRAGNFACITNKDNGDQNTLLCKLENIPVSNFLTSD